MEHGTSQAAYEGRDSQVDVQCLDAFSTVTSLCLSTDVQTSILSNHFACNGNVTTWNSPLARCVKGSSRKLPTIQNGDSSRLMIFRSSERTTRTAKMHLLIGHQASRATARKSTRAASMRE
jgi:hypothetical protein